MEIFSEKDLKLVNDNIDEMMNKIEKKKKKVMEPTIDEMMEIEKIVLKFVKNKKRKVYGGYALNEAIILKNPEDKIYDKEIEVPDIDFYSPEPIKDLHELSNILHDNGYKRVQGKEAMHIETYSIFVNLHNYVDITYMPNKIYHNIPFIVSNGLYITHPSFMKIDYFRMITDPLTSYWRIQKSLKRLRILDHHYPHQIIKKKLEVKNNKTIKKHISDIFNFLMNREDIVLIGDYLYNYYIEESGINIDYIRKIPINKIEAILINYNETGKELIKMLKDKYKDITVLEYYPFFQLTGYSFEIYYKDILIFKGFDYNKRCTPFQIVPVKKFDLEIKDKKNNIMIGSYDTNLLYLMITSIYNKVNKRKYDKEYYNIMIGHILKIREYFLKKNNKTILDESIFKQLIIDCIGESIDPFRESLIRGEKKRALNKPFKYLYEPTNNQTDGSDVNYKFANIAGTVIKNPSNLRILEKFKYVTGDTDEPEDINIV